MPANPSNQDYAWDEFDPEAYVAQYYAVHSPDDDLALSLCCAALQRATDRTGPLDLVDVGTGPSLIPLLAAAPFTRSITAWEFGARNVEWLRAQLSQPPLRPEWAHYWSLVRSGMPARLDLPADPTVALAAKTHVHRGSIFDLPERRWTAATMFFCAESITERQDEFQRACARFAGCVAAGGTLVAAFLARSSGYDVGDQAFPALTVSEKQIRDTFGGLAVNIATREIGSGGDDVHGYSGMIFLTAEAR